MMHHTFIVLCHHWVHNMFILTFFASQVYSDVQCREYYCLLHSAHIDVHISQIFYRQQFITREIYLISFNIVAYFIVLELMYLLEWNIFYKTDAAIALWDIFVLYRITWHACFMASIILLVQGFLTSFWWHFYLMRNTPCITIDNLI